MALATLVFVLVVPPAPRVRAAEPLKVAVKHSPPFSVRTEDGWSGQSIELWRRLATELELDYDFVETDLETMLAGLESSEYDAAVAALTVTSAREEHFDFTHPFETSGLGVASTQGPRTLWPTVFDVVGGVSTGFWWSTVTMTTVGYGDTTPRSWAGRGVALGWMLVSVVLISTFTASVTSMLTVERLSMIDEPGDLARYRVATVRASPSEGWLRREGFDYRDYPSGEDALKDLVAGKFDVLVYDKPLLENLLAGRGRRRVEGSERVHLLPLTFQRQDYAIGLPPGSPLREPINARLPDLLAEED